jgi:hypothetical protein
MPLGHYKLKQTPDGQVVLLQEMGRLGLKQKDLVRLAGVSRSTLYFQRNPERGVNKGGTTRADTAYRIAKALAQTELKREPKRKELDKWLNRCFELV